jgi:hypothetical protein
MTRRDDRGPSDTLQWVRGPERAASIRSRGSSDFIRASGSSPRRQAGHMTEGRQPFTAETKTLAKGPSTYDPFDKERSFAARLANKSDRSTKDVRVECYLKRMRDPAISAARADAGFLARRLSRPSAFGPGSLDRGGLRRGPAATRPARRRRRRGSEIRRHLRRGPRPP